MANICTMPLVSVIIPVYNRRKLLQRAIESVRAQTYAEYELIVVDDASDDGLDESNLKSLGRRYSFIRNECNRGVSYARNRGVSHAAGHFIAFLDSDDQWHPRKLAIQTEYMRQNPEMKICQSREIWIRNGKRVNPPKTHIKRGGDLFIPSLHRCMITPSSVMMRRDLFDRFGGFNESLPAAEDYDLWLRITNYYPVGLIDEDLLVRYGGHPDQLSGIAAIDRYRIRALIDLLEHESLSKHKEQAVKAVLVKKAQIFANGSRKRGNLKLYEQYTNIAEKYSSH